MKQRITIDIETTDKAQKAYPEGFIESSGGYNNLQHFFEDIGYKVLGQKAETLPNNDSHLPGGVVASVFRLS